MESRSSWPNCVLVSLATMIGTWWCFLPASVSTNYHFESLRPSIQGHVSSFHIVTGFSQLIFFDCKYLSKCPENGILLSVLTNNDAFVKEYMLEFLNIAVFRIS